MPTLVERADAKVNLTLEVLGRRPDGYHELHSLVAFATVGDELRFDAAPTLSVSGAGPYFASIDGPNLVERTAERVAQAQVAAGFPPVTGRLTLLKNLPVAAGLGGGSADAAAVLRLLQRVQPIPAGRIDWTRLAASLGADVPVCVSSRAALMTGIGEVVTPLEPLPEVAILLVNPGVPLATPAVFAELRAAPLVSPPLPRPPARFDDIASLVAGLEGSRNDLEPAAIRLCPAVQDVLGCLKALRGALLARMSGSGPTCFALFHMLADAEAGRQRIAAASPAWWTAAAMLR